MTARDNQWLVVLKNVVLTPIIEPVIINLDLWFKDEGLVAYVTSGLRTPEGQLELIQGLAHRHKVEEEFPEIVNAALNNLVQFKKNGEVYSVYEWQPAWSRLLNKGVIVNPPLRAVALFDYIRDGVNKKGQYINPSPHFRGTAFDIGGGNNSVTDEMTVVSRAFKSGMIGGFRGFLVERMNNAIHCDCTETLPGVTV